MSKWIGYLEEIIIVVVLVLMSSIAFLNVITRNFLNLSLAFTEEITVNLFVLLTFVGAAIGVRKGAHLGFSLLLEKVSISMKRVLIIFIGIVSTLLFLVITYFSIEMIQFQLQIGSTTPALRWPRWIFSLAIPIGSVLCIYRTIEATIIQVKELSMGKEGNK